MPDTVAALAFLARFRLAHYGGGQIGPGGASHPAVLHLGVGRAQQCWLGVQWACGTAPYLATPRLAGGGNGAWREGRLTLSRLVGQIVWQSYVEGRLGGETRAAACRRLSIAVGTAMKFDRGDPTSTGHQLWLDRCAGRWPFAEVAAEERDVDEAPRGAWVPAANIKTATVEGRKALTDFDLFGRRFYGEVSMRWHVESAEILVARLEETGRSHIVINAPPGTGKSAFLRRAAGWSTVRNRAIRGARCANTGDLARREVRNQRRMLQRLTPIRQKPELVRRGYAVDAVATLSADYGPFRPDNRELWTNDAYTVMQEGGVYVAEKEPTWSAFGMDSAIIGNRLDFMIGDDLDTPRSVRANLESRTNFFEDWDNEFETRLEPDGVLVVCGQRLSVRDIYRYCLDKKMSTDDVEVLDQTRNTGQQYTHITYKAHYDDLCKGEHRTDAPAWPDGCLLDPYRAPYRMLATIRENKPDTYFTVYQQGDGDPKAGLVDRIWIDGGLDAEKILRPGCWDTERSLWQAPRTPGIGVIQVDPSGTNHWACQAWLYIPPPPTPRVEGVDGQLEPVQQQQELLGHQRILLDVRDGPMEAPDLLDWNHSEKVFHGVFEEWYRNFLRIGHRLNYVVVEINAAQRYLLQYEHHRRWTSSRQVTTMPHETGIRKLDKTLGVYAIQGPYRYGLVRLPAGDEASRRAVAPLVDQVTRWGKGSLREDQVMAQWFGEYNLAKMAPTPRGDENERAPRPSWLTKRIPVMR